MTCRRLHLLERNFVFVQEIRDNAVPELFRTFVRKKRPERKTGGAQKHFIFILEVQIETA